MSARKRTYQREASLLRLCASALPSFSAPVGRFIAPLRRRRRAENVVRLLCAGWRVLLAARLLDDNGLSFSSCV